MQPTEVTVMSSNPDLVAVSSSGINGSEQLTINPGDNKFGVATITVTVLDGGNDGALATIEDNASSSFEFQIEVSPVNDLPTIAPIADVEMVEDAAESLIELKGISAGGEDQPFIVRASSSNLGLMSAPTVVHDSNAATGTLYFTPKPNRSGSTTITVEVEDGGFDGLFSTVADNALTSTTFQVVVLPVNDPPVADAIDDIRVSEDAGIPVIALTGLDSGIEEDQVFQINVASNNADTVDVHSVTYLNSQEVGKLYLELPENSFGRTEVTLQIMDGGLDNDLSTVEDNEIYTDAFEVVVDPVNDHPTLAAIGNMGLKQNASQQTVNLHGISSGGNENQPLRITATSDNTELIPEPSVSYATHRLPAKWCLLRLLRGTALLRSQLSSRTVGWASIFRQPTTMVYLSNSLKS